MTAIRRGRWAISFADLCLLLLGFFVLLGASRQGAGEAVSQVSEYFGGKPSGVAGHDIPASQLFEPGEAMLTSRGRALVGNIATQAVEKKKLLIVASAGEDKAGRRFDRWELAAARLAATARALRESGLPEDRIRLRWLEETDSAGAGRGGGQHLLIQQKEPRETGG